MIQQYWVSSNKCITKNVILVTSISCRLFSVCQVDLHAKKLKHMEKIVIENNDKRKHQQLEMKI